MDRDKIAEQYKWDLDKIYVSREEFDKDYDEISKEVDNFDSYEKIIDDGATGLYDTLVKYFEIDRRIEKLYTYTHLLFDENTGDNDRQALNGRVSNLVDEFNKKCYFVIPTILKKDYKELEKYYEDEPKLLNYEIFLKNEYRYKKHTLSDIEEKLLSNMSKMLNNDYQTYSLLNDSDLKFGDIHDEDGNLVELTCSNYSIYIESKNRNVRKEAFNTLYKTYKQFINTFASTFYGNVKENMTISTIKKYDSFLECCLFSDDVDKSIYDGLIDVVSDNLDVLFKYYDLKKELLGVDELHLYDIYTPIIKEYSGKYPFEKAKGIVLNALSILGDDYISILKQGYDDRWIDVYPTENKRTGGYSSGCYETYPYILLNYQDKYNDMSTLAHESGHSMHSYYTINNNDYQYASYTIFVAEIASTVNELLLAKYMLKNSSSKEEKMFILDNLMTLFKSTIYRQTMFAEFERDVYEDAENGETLTADYLSNKYYELNKKYFGSNVVVDSEVRYEWARIPHFYLNFYVYKYATGLSAACHIVNDILSGKDGAVENYKRFLKCGRTKSPLESLKLAGVDLTKKEVIKSAIKMFEEVIDEFKKLQNGN
jgi:oligoendopeptidase F